MPDGATDAPDGLAVRGNLLHAVSSPVDELDCWAEVEGGSPWDGIPRTSHRASHALVVHGAVPLFLCRSIVGFGLTRKRGSGAGATEWREDR